MLLASLAWADPPDAVSGPAHEAIVEAVRARIGESAEVHIDSLLLRVTHDLDRRVIATAPPGATLGRATRFLLFEPADDASRRRRTRVGYAEAVVRVSHTYTTVVRRVRGGSILAETDVAVEVGDIGRVRLERLPQLVEVVGARTRRAVEPGEPITASALTIPPLVRSGESVVTLARIGSIEARGRATASQRGSLGDLIRLVNPESGRRLRGRVVARGQVEVIHEP